VKFRKKPVVIEAIRWTGENYNEIMEFTGIDPLHMNPNTNGIFIETLEGRHEASVGDWIIRGIKGEYYPIKNDIFEATYEQVNEDS